MTKKQTDVPVGEQVWQCVLQCGESGASASEITDEIMIPTKSVLSHIRRLAKEGQLRSAKIRRPWRHNPSENQSLIREVWVASQQVEAS